MVLIDQEKSKFRLYPLWIQGRKEELSHRNNLLLNLLILLEIVCLHMCKHEHTYIHITRDCLSLVNSSGLWPGLNLSVVCQKQICTWTKCYSHIHHHHHHHNHFRFHYHPPYHHMEIVIESEFYQADALRHQNTARMLREIVQLLNSIFPKKDNSHSSKNHYHCGSSLTRLIFLELLHVRLLLYSVGIAGAGFLWIGWPSCDPTSSIRALKWYGSKRLY